MHLIKIGKVNLISEIVQVRVVVFQLLHLSLVLLCLRLVLLQLRCIIEQLLCVGLGIKYSVTNS